MYKTIATAGGLVLAATFVATGLTPGSLPFSTPERPAALVVRPAETTTPGVVTLKADVDGHFRVDAMISGRRVPMLVDTGATVVALSYEHGETLGLVSGGDRFDSPVSTANGQIGAKRVVLRDVRVGSLSVPDVQAVVLARGAMDGALLGMSFLSRLRKLESSRDRLVMER